MGSDVMGSHSVMLNCDFQLLTINSFIKLLLQVLEVCFWEGQLIKSEPTFGVRYLLSYSEYGEGADCAKYVDVIRRQAIIPHHVCSLDIFWFWKKEKTLK